MFLRDWIKRRIVWAAMASQPTDPPLHRVNAKSPQARVKDSHLHSGARLGCSHLVIVLSALTMWCQGPTRGKRPTQWGQAIALRSGLHFQLAHITEACLLRRDSQTVVDGSGVLGTQGLWWGLCVRAAAWGTAAAVGQSGAALQLELHWAPCSHNAYFRMWKPEK